MKKFLAAALFAIFLMTGCTQDLTVEPDDVEILAKKRVGMETGTGN